MNTKNDSKNIVENENSLQLVKTQDRVEFFKIIQDIMNNETVKKMKDFKQHCNTSCYEHCLHVAYYSYIVSKKLGLDYESTARAAMLHDLFLYDWRMKFKEPSVYGLHTFNHPKIALKNALMIFDLNEKEQDIIVKHMWPATIILPKYKESYVVTLMDKYSAIREICTYYIEKLRIKKIYRYAYIFLCLLLLKRM